MPVDTKDALTIMFAFGSMILLLIRTMIALLDLLHKKK